MNPKVCQICNKTLSEIQQFIQKTEKTNGMFQELLKEESLSSVTINEIREKFELGRLEIENEDRKRRLRGRQYDYSFEDSPLNEGNWKSVPLFNNFIKFSIPF